MAVSADAGQGSHTSVVVGGPVDDRLVPGSCWLHAHDACTCATCVDLPGTWPKPAYRCCSNNREIPCGCLCVSLCVEYVGDVVWFGTAVAVAVAAAAALTSLNRQVLHVDLKYG
jgi:hypothetical protein